MEDIGIKSSTTLLFFVYFALVCTGQSTLLDTVPKVSGIEDLVPVSKGGPDLREINELFGSRLVSAVQHSKQLMKPNGNTLYVSGGRKLIGGEQAISSTLNTSEKVACGYFKLSYGIKNGKAYTRCYRSRKLGYLNRSPHIKSCSRANCRGKFYLYDRSLCIKPYCCFKFYYCDH